MKYGKIENGALINAPRVIQTEDKVIYQPSEKTLIENGYKPVIETPYPIQTEEDMKTYTAVYIEEAEQIVQEWQEVIDDLSGSKEQDSDANYLELLFRQNARQSQDITDIQLAVCEIYEAAALKE